jgi:hypothetical protein
MTWRYGELPLIEHRGHWRSHPNDDDVTEDEYEDVYDAFQRHTDEVLKQNPYDRLCYIIGDFQGDRTQTLVVNDLSVLNADLIRDLQSLLRRPNYRNWRIAVEAAILEDWIMIYPGAVCTDRRLEPGEVDEAIELVRDRQMRIRQRREDERQERIDRVRPLLRDAYAVALVENELAYQVQVEICSGKDDGLVRMWVIHPIPTEYGEINDYVVDPDAYLLEEFSLTADGEIRRGIWPKQPNALLLALWEFPADERKRLRFEHEGRVSELPY